EIVRAEAAGDPHFRRGPVAAWLAVGFDRDPIRMRGLHVVVGGVWISAGNHDHAKFAAAGDEFTEWVAIAEPLAAMVKRNFGRVISDAAAGAQANGVGARAFEIIEPELRIEFGGIVFDQSELGPAHWFIGPRWNCRRRLVGRGSN